MKKLLIVALIILTMITLFGSPVYMVDTDRGKKSVVIPEDMTEREVMLELATEYYNLSYQVEDYIKANEELVKQVEEYRELTRNQQSQYTEIVNKYAEVIKESNKVVKGLFGFNTGFGNLNSDIFTLNRLSITGGILLNSKFGITGSFDYYTTQTFGFSLGMLLAI